MSLFYLQQPLPFVSTVPARWSAKALLELRSETCGTSRAGFCSKKLVGLNISLVVSCGIQG